MSGELTQRSGADAVLCIPSKPNTSPSAAADSKAVPVSEQSPECGDGEEREEQWEWSECTHEWWWKLTSIDDADNLGLSRTVMSPAGPLKLAMCCECNYGPCGYQRDEHPTIWLACDLLHQQDPSMANKEEDFGTPAGINMEMLEKMIESGMAIVQFHVTFEEQVLGMQLADSAHGDAVVVVAFTELDGESLPAERSGKIAVGDKVARVNGQGTVGLDYAAVLDMVREAERPVTIHFERRGLAAPDGTTERVPHEDWK